MTTQELPTVDELVYRLEHVRQINDQIRLFTDKANETDWDDFMLQQLISQKNTLLDQLDHTLRVLDLKPVLGELFQTHP
jgi:hypothetical protein